MGLITSLITTAAIGAAVGGGISKATGGSFWKGAGAGALTGGVGAGIGRATGHLKASEKRGAVLQAAQAQQAKTSLAGTDKARLAMTPGGTQGQELQEGDFRTKRNIFGN